LPPGLEVDRAGDWSPACGRNHRIGDLRQGGLAWDQLHGTVTDNRAISGTMGDFGGACGLRNQDRAARLKGPAIPPSRHPPRVSYPRLYHINIIYTILIHKGYAVMVCIRYIYAICII